MASRSHLKELLREDQEPFILTSYIADKQCQLKKQPSLRNHQNLQLKKKPKQQNASFSSHFCKNACFFSSFNVDSPDYLKKSPLLSPAAGKSPARALFLHVPAKTAALLLDAATRIQKNSSESAKSRTRVRNSGFGLLGSVIKRLTNRTRTRKLESGDDVIRWADSVKTSSSGRGSGGSKRDEIRVGLEKTDLAEDQAGISNGRLSSVWSEENKSLASSSSSSSSCSRSASTSGSGDLSEEDGEEEVKFVNSLDKENSSNGDVEDFTFCLSPLSPFRFALHNSPDRRSPVFRSPANSPPRRKFQDDANYEEDPSVKFQAEDEEEKEQNSPVSVLDAPFGDDECEEEEGGERHEFDLESSYAFVERTQRQLLQKLRKFERLAELDPIELERRMEEEQDERDFEELESESYGNDDHSSSVDTKTDIDGYLVDQGLLKPGMKRLLSDLISEEEEGQRRLAGDNYESIFKRVCKRLESWDNVEPNTIEMMVGIDLRGETNEWKKGHEEISQTATLVELSIFAVLVDELVDELVIT